MHTYQIQLRETRMTKNNTDDVALFDVTRDEDKQTWRVAAFLSPLFRMMHMEFQASLETRREMVAGLGARTIAERLEHNIEPTEQEFLLFASNYPGAPGDPAPLLPYDQVTVRVNEAHDGHPSGESGVRAE